MGLDPSPPPLPLSPCLSLNTHLENLEAANTTDCNKLNPKPHSNNLNPKPSTMNFKPYTHAHLRNPNQHIQISAFWTSLCLHSPSLFLCLSQNLVASWLLDISLILSFSLLHTHLRNQEARRTTHCNSLHTKPQILQPEPQFLQPKPYTQTHLQNQEAAHTTDCKNPNPKPQTLQPKPYAQTRLQNQEVARTTYCTTHYKNINTKTQTLQPKPYTQTRLQNQRVARTTNCTHLYQNHHSKPQTLQPKHKHLPNQEATRTAHCIAYTLNPKSYSLNPNSYSLNPTHKHTFRTRKQHVRLIVRINLLAMLWITFSKVSSLLNLPYEIPLDLTSENFSESSWLPCTCENSPQSVHYWSCHT